MKHHLVHKWRQEGELWAKRRWRIGEMLHSNLNGTFTAEGAVSTEPLIDNNCQGILVAFRARFAANLLRSHIMDGAGGINGGHRGRTMRKSHNAEIAQEERAIGIEQHIFRLDIAVNQFA